MKKVAIVTINFNGEKNTIECVDSLKKISSKEYFLNIYVVDNKSPRVESTEYLAQNLPKIKIPNAKIELIKNTDNLGFAGGCNTGIERALSDTDDYILLLNNDTFVDKNLISELTRIAESDKKIGIVAPKIYFAPGFEFHDKYKKSELGRVFWYAGGHMDWANVYGKHRGVDEVDSGQYDRTELTEFATGCCMLIKREVIEKVGILDYDYFLYYEENDFCQRVKRAGYTIMYAPKAFLWHKNAQSTGGSGSPLQDYFISRNRMLFGNRYAPFRTKLALFRESLKLLKLGRPWQKKGIQDFYMKKFGKGSFIK